MPFNRGLRPEIMKAIRQMNSEGENWWCDLLKLWEPSGSGKEGLRLAIRHNTIDFYRHGARAAHVVFGQCKRNECAPGRVETHLKYLIDDETVGQTIAILRSGSRAWCLDRSDLSREMPEYSGFNKIMSLIDRRFDRLRLKHPRRGLEKKGVDNIIAHNPTIIDVEMGLTGITAPRIDFVAIKNDGRPCIAMYEAKTYDDTALLKSLDDPKGINNQLEKYRKWLKRHREDVVTAYRKTCALLVELHKLGGKEGPAKIVRKVGTPESAVELDITPCLVLFGGLDTTKPVSLDKHLAKLRTNNNIIRADDPGDISIG